MLFDDPSITAPFSSARIKNDLQQVDTLGELINQLAIPFDVAMAEAFQKLGDLAGSKEFSPTYATLHQYVLKLKWAREGYWETGYIVPWISIYSSFRENTQLSSIANHAASCGKSPLIKSPMNPFGTGCRPVELNRDDWVSAIQTTLASGTKETFTPLRPTVKRPLQQTTFLRKPNGQPTQVPLQMQASYQEMGSVPPKKQRVSLAEDIKPDAEADTAAVPALPLAAASSSKGATASATPAFSAPVQMTITSTFKTEKKTKPRKPRVKTTASNPVVGFEKSAGAYDTPPPSSSPSTASSVSSGLPTPQFAPAADLERLGRDTKV
ncbi:hypothetical protein HDU91_004738 [Kappamyces sp. JEL0680]|nr:hypothetical protein HDU91_004738 [Kappamyces sp. JEL0680]